METKVKEYELAVEDCDDARNRLDAVEHDLDGMRGKKEVQERQLETLGTLYCLFSF